MLTATRSAACSSSAHLTRLASSVRAAGLAALCAVSAGAQALSLKIVNVCDDVTEWPPFTYVDRKAPASAPAGDAGAAVVGYSVDVLRRILSPLGVEMRIQLLPWLRCLREVESGREFQVVLNASANAEREQRFWLSSAYYDTTHTYFYSRRRFPKGVPIRSVDDLARFQICGVHGYNYAPYGLRDEQVDRGALDFSRVIAKLLVGRCELGIEKLEAVRAARYKGQQLLADPDIAYAPIPGMAKGEFHMLVSRQHPQGEALLAAINAGLKALRDSGELKALRSRYLP